MVLSRDDYPHQEFQLLCRKLGARYLTRERNEHAKAGNINEAMRHTYGKLILILDADHVPTVDILVKLNRARRRVALELSPVGSHPPKSVAQKA